MVGRRPLEGIRVVELTVWLSGPIGGMLLADLGADVIKIESPAGDPTRVHRAPTAGEAAGDRVVSVTYDVSNRNKRSIVIDLSSDEDRGVLEDLVRTADVFLTNLTTRAVRKLGVDEESIRAINPSIVFAHSGGFGHRGPLADQPVQDMTGMAYSGMLFTMSGEADTPFAPPGATNDVMTGTMVAFGILAALLDRQRTGEGQTVRSSLVMTSLWAQMQLVGSAANTAGAVVTGKPQKDPRSPVLNQYRCGDGKWIAIAVVTPRDWEPFLRAVGLAAESLPDGVDSYADAVTHAGRMREFFDGFFAQRPRDEWLAKLRAEKLWCSPVNTIEDVLRDDNIRENHYLSTLDDGTVTVAMPFQLDGLVPPLRSGPQLGAHDAEIRDEVRARRAGG
ncbi:CoA transferase [Dactylosporangium fulvum]|uniref:CoA transferase n=1 Tax=Dactylosporangium fulvum TaxID=53359 RepID=A0ABY5VRM3_9ACTN|nr:CoA transferase [Dactylosporangium fulvum]UWP79744.1 CoA transferase [Dactylosporangium fulvum]